MRQKILIFTGVFSIILANCSINTPPQRTLPTVTMQNSTIDNLIILLDLAFLSPPLTFNEINNVFMAEFNWSNRFINEQGIPITSYRATQNVGTISNPLGGVRVSVRNFRNINHNNYVISVYGLLINRNSCTSLDEFMLHVQNNPDYSITREISLHLSAKFSVRRRNLENRSLTIQAIGNNCVNIVEIFNNFP